MLQKKIMICYSDAGNGPLSASEALRRAFNKIDKDLMFDVSIADVLKETTDLGFTSVRLYNYLLGKNMVWNTLCLRIFYKSRLIRSGALLNHSINKLAAIFEREKPSALVFTNPWIMGYALNAIQKLPQNNRPKTVSLVIDLGMKLLPPSWYQQDVDLFIVPTQEAKEQLISFGADKDKIKILGMPVHPNILAVQGSSHGHLGERAKRSADARPHVLVMAGREGTKNTIKIARDLFKLCEKLPIRLTILCGRNLRLQRRIEKDFVDWRSRTNLTNQLSKSGLPGNSQEMKDNRVTIQGYVSDIYSYMREADLLITKPGALTISEAIAMNLPLILDVSPVVMGQEIGNVEYVKSKGLGLIAGNCNEISLLVEQYLTDENLKSRIHKNMNSASALAGTFAIVQEIVSLLETKQVFNSGMVDRLQSTSGKTD